MDEFINYECFHKTASIQFTIVCNIDNFVSNIRVDDLSAFTLNVIISKLRQKYFYMFRQDLTTSREWTAEKFVTKRRSLKKKKKKNQHLLFYS